MTREGRSKHEIVRRMIIMEEFEKAENEDRHEKNQGFSFPPGVRLISPDDDSWD